MCGALIVFVSSGAAAQTAPAAAAAPAPRLAARLTPAQKAQFEEAMEDAKGQKYPEALKRMKALLQELPGDPELSKYAGQVAIHAGDNAYARDTLKPVVLNNLEDWQAAVLLARACAQADDKNCRNAAMIQMAMLHKDGVTPPAMKEYFVEQTASQRGSVQIFTSLEPYSSYQVYSRARVLDEQGKLVMQLTLESGDFDQPGFAKQYPKEAAAGLRRFSLDGYQDTGVNGSGQKTQTHSTYGFLVGQPAYDAVRQQFLDIANGKSKPISSRAGLIVQ